MSFTAQEMKDLRVVFDVYDPSKSGFITIGDVRKVLKILGFKCSQQRLKDMMKDEGIGTEGLVSFMNVLQFVNQLQDSDYDLYEEMEQAFNLIDIDQDKQLSTDDIHKTCKHIGMKLSKADIEGMIEEADMNGDGLISLQEFIDTMKKTPLFS